MAFDDHVSIILSTWSSISSWFTPPVLFVFLNLTILTIAISSNFNSSKHSEKPQQHQDQNADQSLYSVDSYSSRSSEAISAVEKSPDTDADSLVRSLNEIKKGPSSASADTNFQFKTPETENDVTNPEIQDTETEKIEETEQESVEDNHKTMDEVYRELIVSHVSNNSHVPPRSLSARWHSVSLERNDAVEARRPATVKEGKAGVLEGEDGVDAKADDFINKFKQRLKLQRVDSIAKYNKMVNRVTEE